MIYNEEANIYILEEVKDDMGGYSKVKKLLKTIKCKVSPYVVSSLITENQIKTSTMAKLFTKDKIMDDLDMDFFIEYRGKMYKKESVCDYDKCILVTMGRE